MNQFLRKAAERAARDLTQGYAVERTDDVGAKLRMALDHHRERRLHLAEPIYQEILAFDPDNVDALHLYGTLKLQRSEAAAALQLLQRATLLKPDFTAAWCHYGAALHALGQSEDAITAYTRALEIDPAYAEAHFNLGNTYLSLKEFESASVCYRKAVGYDPKHVAAYVNMAQAFYDLNQFDEAMSACHSALLVDKHNTRAYNMLGLALMGLGQTKGAAEAFMAAIRIDPAYAVAYGNLGRAFLALKEPAKALEACIQAVQLQDTLAAAHCNRAIALQELGRLDEALQAVQKALMIDPTLADAHNTAGNIYLESSLVDEAIKAFRKALEIKPDYREVASNAVMALQYAPTTEPAEIRAEAEQYGRRFAPFHIPPRRAVTEVRRIGFLSGDLGLHPVGHFLEALLAGGRNQGVEFVAYSNRGSKDPQGEKLAGLTSAWRHIIGLDDSTVAEIVQDDRIDVLVDLAGHTGGNRLGVFASRPAPIQVSWLGFSGTTGLNQMDALIGDAWITPNGEDELYSERVLRLPGHWLCFTPPPFASEQNPPPCTLGEPFTFGVFNATKKINRDTVAVWAQILREAPDSRLMIKSKNLAAASLRRQYLSWFRYYDIDSERIVFRQATTWAAHFASYNQVDLSLDTFPYTGATTTCESLWMGVPVVTLNGPGYVGKMSASVLHGAGLHDWITDSREAYIARAVAAVNNPSSLKSLREDLRDTFLASRLCDQTRFAADWIEAVKSLAH